MINAKKTKAKRILKALKLLVELIFTRLMLNPFKLPLKSINSTKFHCVPWMLHGVIYHSQGTR